MNIHRVSESFSADFYSRQVCCGPTLIPCRAEIMPAIFPDTSRIILKSFYILATLRVRRVSEEAINKTTTLDAGVYDHCHHMHCRIYHIYER